MTEHSAFPHLFEPIELGGLKLRNRLMMTTHGPRLSQVRYLRYLEERSRGGVALVGVNAGFGIFGYPAGTGRVVPGQAADFDAIAPDPTTPEGIARYDRTVIPMLRTQGEGDLAKEVEAYAKAMPAARTDKEMIAAGLLSQIKAQRQRSKVQDVEGPEVAISGRAHPAPGARWSP